ncbi:hypothetical protein SAMN05444156_0994 [Verrucomicrobium sp. GAS474]|uniref:hypothetical protein n=1 Tax=Verrucomicrobium sp. GAS474 TaxID=1882831 RepID=UPI000879CB71|nr:hypothetical protein [Verrucomicrobium sp. GAS474]SDT94929.1 hypothetical protein SAMN05444156_0994 [Verrucomicrobium sp. GAS474]
MKRLRCASLFLGLTLALARAETTVQDGFNKESRNALDGAATETGESSWEATPNVRILKQDDGDGAVGVRDEQAFLLRLPVTAEAENVAIEARVHPDAKDPNRWIGVGMGAKGTLDAMNVNINWPLGVYLVLDGKGHYQCLYNPGREGVATTQQIQGGDATGFSPGGWNRLKVEYHRKNNTVSMWVNGEKVVSSANLEKKGFVSSIAVAGLSGYGMNPDQRNIDDVVLTTP